MILTKKSLREWEGSTFTPLTPEQKHAILERFGTEPEPYVWSEQDIVIQLQNYVGCGEFVKAMIDNGYRLSLPDGVDF